MVLLDIPDYYLMPLPEGLEKRDSELWSITGWFEQIQNDIPATAFGGYFRLDLELNEIVQGQMIDVWGPSIIKGEMSDREMQFKKRYEFREDIIEYKFKKQGYLWVGGYQGNIGVGEGKAQCVAAKIADDAFQVICGSRHDL
ncbi:hypothetical protein HYZ97_04385 [Candidatus Pacearchaeota archaeon]|nr:hypothetical protein [Candidatus Pacearchaeota archaeon]